ncbi:MAG TPA: zf-HC2 domain-containing protein [Planctomycetota bacterium]|nr:zf-HC2 domain-containing protein [Planctomycetota bacterium]
MTCPKPDVLSQWADGSLDARDAERVARHAATCATCAAKAADLRAVGAWIAAPGESGPSCLGVDEMAAALDSGRIPLHVRTCPRCASEFRALKPEKETRRATRRRERPEAPLKAWAVAAGVFVAVGILLVVAGSQSASPKVEFAYRRPTPLNREPSPPVPSLPSSTLRPPERPATPPAPSPVRPPVALPTPAVPAPEVAPPAPTATPATPETPLPPPQEPIREAVQPPTPRVVAALSVKSGTLSALTVDGKWAKPARVEEGMTLRADSRATIDFAQARILLDRDSRFSVSKEEFALLEGGLAAEVSAGGRFVLVLDEQRFFPQTQNARVLLCAKPGALLIEEGAAKWKETFLREGTEYSVKKDSVEAKKIRSLTSSARGREQLTWRMDLSNQTVAKRNTIGRVDASSEGRMLVSEPIKDGTVFYGTAVYNNGGEAAPVFTVKPNTAIRFRYFLREPGHLELVMWNSTKSENFNRPLEPVVRQWTTVTVYARDVAANKGGKPVTCEVGDKYTSIGLFVGLAGMPAEVTIDRLEILEIDR